MVFVQRIVRLQIIGRLRTGLWTPCVHPTLRTKDEAETLALLHSKNEAHRQPVLNLQIDRIYLTATDPEVANRTWQVPMDEMTKTKTGPTRARHIVAMKDKAFDIIRNLAILETRSEHFLPCCKLARFPPMFF